MARGLVISIVGPDGTGKSSVAAGLADVPPAAGQPVHRYHWRPMLLPAPGAVLGTSAAATEDPHGRPPRPKSLSLVLLVYYWLDHLLGAWLRLRPAARDGALVVLERGYDDMAVDPRRYRLDVGPETVRRLGRLLPRPDVLVVLDADPEVVHARKPELGIDELARQRARWREIAAAHPRSVVVDATAPEDRVLAAVRDAILAPAEPRTHVALPLGHERRLWLPAAPARACAAGLALYQPSARLPLLAHRVATVLARSGLLGRLPGRPVPSAVARSLAAHVPEDGSLAVLSSNHPGRFVALVLDADGRPSTVAKVSVPPRGDEGALHAEADALTAIAPRLGDGVRAPRLLAHGPGLVLVEAIDRTARRDPWVLPAPVASGLGELAAQPGGRHCHGDAAPWNLLRSSDGEWVLVDWEHARVEAMPFFDVLHWLVQAHVELGRPTADEIHDGLAGAPGWIDAALTAYADAAAVGRDGAHAALRRYLTEPNPTFGTAGPPAPQRRLRDALLGGLR